MQLDHLKGQGAGQTPLISAVYALLVVIELQVGGVAKTDAQLEEEIAVRCACEHEGSHPTVQVTIETNQVLTKFAF